MKVVQHIKQTTSALVHSAEENRDECKIQIRQTGNNMMSSKQGWMKKNQKGRKRSALLLLGECSLLSKFLLQSFR